MDQNPDETITGFIHNLSPLKDGPKKKYFDFNLQTNEKTAIRTICFSPPKRKMFAEAVEKSSPVKIRKFLHDKKEGSTDILISDNVVIDHLQPTDVSFEREDLVPANLNLSMLSMISPNKLLTIKAKIINLQEPRNVNMANCILKKVDALLIDPYGSTKIVLWEDDINKVQEGGTYEFQNLRLKKNKYNQELYVNPAKYDSKITECTAFEEPLAVPEDVPDEFTRSEIKGEVHGISDAQLDHCCIKCNKRVKPEKIAICQNVRCKLKQKLERCKKQWYLKALVAHEDKTVNLIFRHDKIMKALTWHKFNTSNLSEDIITDAFLSFPSFHIAYDKKTMIVTDISLSQ